MFKQKFNTKTTRPERRVEAEARYIRELLNAAMPLLSSLKPTPKPTPKPKPTA